MTNQVSLISSPNALAGSTFRCDLARRGRAGDAQDAEALGVPERVLHFAQFRRALEFQRRIAARDGEGQGVAGAGADQALHVGEAADLLAVDGGDDVADLKPGPLGGAGGFDLVDARRGARLAEEGERQVTMIARMKFAIGPAATMAARAPTFL